MSFMTQTYVTVIKQSLRAQHIEIPVSLKIHAFVANSMLVNKNMDALVLTPNYFDCFERNIGNMAGTRKRPNR